MGIFERCAHSACVGLFGGLSVSQFARHLTGDSRCEAGEHMRQSAACETSSFGGHTGGGGAEDDFATWDEDEMYEATFGDTSELQSQQGRQAETNRRHTTGSDLRCSMPRVSQ
jgi:hypothetical protein